MFQQLAVAETQQLQVECVYGANYVLLIQALHNAGLVHRDVKPMNIIFAEDEKSFKLIDLGACADLRSGTNYIPDESILDPTYCPPEQVLLTLYAVLAACFPTTLQPMPGVRTSNASICKSALHTLCMPHLDKSLWYLVCCHV